jgi:cytochrome c oxidase cbb3-type subunit 3
VSDFLNSGWSVFVAAATLIGLVACLVLLFIASRRKVMADDNSTGHVFDGNLKELNNPLPRWWMILFILTIVFAFGYVFAFPGLGSAPGFLGWTSRGEVAADDARAAAALTSVYAGFKDRSAESLSQDPKAMGIGERLFINNCAACHGSDARGTKGFPDLTDRDWIHGGSPEKIEETITGGRTGVMPPMIAAVGSPADLHDLAHFVLSLSGSAHDSIAAARGKPKFVICAACHGADGKGNQAIGAPNLTDQVWLHGWGEEAIADIVTHGKTNVMPAQKGRLMPEQIHVLASYVWNLSQPRQTAQK